MQKLNRRMYDNVIPVMCECKRVKNKIKFWTKEVIQINNIFKAEPVGATEVTLKVWQELGPLSVQKVIENNPSF